MNETMTACVAYFQARPYHRGLLKLLLQKHRSHGGLLDVSTCPTRQRQNVMPPAACLPVPFPSPCASRRKRLKKLYRTLPIGVLLEVTFWRQKDVQSGMAFNAHF